MILAAEPRYRVALVGDGSDQAAFRLHRLIEWAGFDQTRFDQCEVTQEESTHGSTAVDHQRRGYWDRILARNTVLLPMGGVAGSVFIGRPGILAYRGYPAPGPAGSWVIPTVHPGFIQRGQAKWSAAFIQDLQKAVTLAAHGMPPQFTDYRLDPSPADAVKWAEGYRQHLHLHPGTRLAFDIETPGKDEDEDEVDLGEDQPDATWHIHRIGFSYRGLSALSIPWEPPYLASIKLLLGSAGEKVVWNSGFDVPRIRRAGVQIEGTTHDAMVAWHILHSDLPKSLRFVATFTCPWQPAWKHLSGSRPAFYNATDADVEWRSMEVIERELRRVGLWDVYVRDVVELEPILVHMSSSGLLVDPEVRLDRAVRLDARIRTVRGQIESRIPTECRRIERIYVKEPKNKTGLLSRHGRRVESVCSHCGLARPRKDHFKRFVKKLNPCADGVRGEREIDVVEWYRLAGFKISRNLLIAYHRHLNRPLPMVWDKAQGKKKVSFGEEQMKKLMLKYPQDPVYGEVLDFRGLDKLAGTYIGRITE